MNVRDRAGDVVVVDDPVYSMRQIRAAVGPRIPRAVFDLPAEERQRRLDAIRQGAAPDRYVVHPPLDGVVVVTWGGGPLLSLALCDLFPTKERM
jgi:hypothetical protein